jgi:hypothetical protein
MFGLFRIVFELLLKEYKSITYKTGCMLQRNSCSEWEMYAGCLIHQDFSSISNGYFPPLPVMLSDSFFPSPVHLFLFMVLLSYLCVQDLPPFSCFNSNLFSCSWALSHFDGLFFCFNSPLELEPWTPSIGFQIEDVNKPLLPSNFHQRTVRPINNCQATCGGTSKAGMSVCAANPPRLLHTDESVCFAQLYTHALLAGTSRKSQDSLLHLCVNQSWRQRSSSPNWNCFVCQMQNWILWKSPFVRLGQRIRKPISW